MKTYDSSSDEPEHAESPAEAWNLAMTHLIRGHGLYDLVVCLWGCAHLSEVHEDHVVLLIEGAPTDVADKISGASKEIADAFSRALGRKVEVVAQWDPPTDDTDDDYGPFKDLPIQVNPDIMIKVPIEAVMGFRDSIPWRDSMNELDILWARAYPPHDVRMALTGAQKAVQAVHLPTQLGMRAAAVARPSFSKPWTDEQVVAAQDIVGTGRMLTEEEVESWNQGELLL